MLIYLISKQFDKLEVTDLAAKLKLLLLRKTRDNPFPPTTILAIDLTTKLALNCFLHFFPTVGTEFCNILPSLVQLIDCGIFFEYGCINNAVHIGTKSS